MSRFALPLFVVVVLAATCSNGGDLSEVPSTLNSDSAMLLETETTTSMELTYILGSPASREVIVDEITGETVLRYITPTTTGSQSGVVVVPKFSENVWNHVELAATTCRKSSLEVEDFFDCSPAIGKLCYYANSELTDYKMNENRNIELTNALNNAVRVFCFTANYIQTLELVEVLSYRQRNSELDKFTERFEDSISSRRFSLFRNFNFYEINTGNANIESILDLGDAVFDYFTASRNEINFEFVELFKENHDNDELDDLISDTNEISEFCIEAIYFTRAGFANWRDRIEQCLHYSENYCHRNNFDSIKCRGISILAKIEQLWQDLPVVCLQDTSTNSINSSEVCQDTAIDIRDNYRQLVGSYTNDYGLASHESSNFGRIFETITGILEEGQVL